MVLLAAVEHRGSRQACSRCATRLLRQMRCCMRRTSQAPSPLSAGPAKRATENASRASGSRVDGRWFNNASTTRGSKCRRRRSRLALCSASRPYGPLWPTLPSKTEAGLHANRTRKSLQRHLAHAFEWRGAAATSVAGVGGVSTEPMLNSRALSL